MRRITSRETERKSRRRKQLTVGLVLIFLMFFSTLGYSFQLIGNNGEIGGNDLNAPAQIINYNGFEFESRGIFWTLNKGGENFIFAYNPNEVERSYEKVNLLESYVDKPLYIDSDSAEAKAELRANLLKFTSSIENACLSNEEDCDEEIKINCNENFIKIREVSNNALEGITQENNCVFINAKKENLIKMTDEFLFKVLGIES
jgi:hypothetical protein|tara:strand:+ start:402 stop:1010 length:609 start_codon:yes stop_codon:yes gene_type:complete